MSNAIKIYPTVNLSKHNNGTFSYTDTYGELHNFSDADEIWAHLTDDGEEFSPEVEAFIFDN